MLTRRDFLQRSSLVALAPSVPGFVASSARADQLQQPNDRVLVVIQLDGGNDGINTVVPFADEGYARHRSALRLPTHKLIKLDDEVALHPSLKAAAELIDDGRLAIVQGVGYPNPDRSHFRSMAIWHAGLTDAYEQSSDGWIGRALDSRRSILAPGANSIFVGHEELPVALRGRRSVAATLLRTEDATLQSDVNFKSTLGTSLPESELASYVHRTMLDAYTTSDQLAAMAGRNSDAARYPDTAFAARLQLIAQLIKSEAGPRVYYTSQSGYDTHSVQLPQHARLLLNFGRGLKAFLDDLAAFGVDKRVLVLAFSEFGRRVAENGSLGTDHGAAGPVFIAGPTASPGLIGRAPSLTDLEDGDLKVSIDFRQVYATVLDDWLGMDSEPILSGRFERLPLI